MKAEGRSREKARVTEQPEAESSNPTRATVSVAQGRDVGRGWALRAGEDGNKTAKKLGSEEAGERGEGEARREDGEGRDATQVRGTGPPFSDGEGVSTPTEERGPGGAAEGKGPGTRAETAASSAQCDTALSGRGGSGRRRANAAQG